MHDVIASATTVETDRSFVVFLIGMRVNRFWHLRKWTWAAGQMGRMLSVLYQQPEKGFLHGETFFRMPPLATLMVSYWRDFDALERFARAKDDPHARAWREFYRRIGSEGSVGIWHETYVVEAGRYEVFYNNMPPFGLGKALDALVPVTTAHRRAARSRMAGSEQRLAPDLDIAL